MNQFYNRHFLKLSDFSKKDIYELLNISLKLKNDKKKNKEIKKLYNKNIILIFEKESTRTRCSFEIACYDQDAKITYLDKHNSHIGYKESIKDTARILSQIYDGIVFRGKNQKDIEILSKYSNIPVWNGLTKEFHPIQILADLLTIQECLINKSLDKISLSYIGDINNNIANSLIEASLIIGFQLNLISPKKLWPNNTLFNNLLLNKNKIFITDNINDGVKNTDFIYTDVWLSMGESSQLWESRIHDLYIYQVNKKLLLQTKNKNVKVMHCLPSLHIYNHYKKYFNNKIIFKYNLFDGLEITDEVFESQNSIIFKQSENKLHVIKAIILLTLLKNKY
ncbi:ornithine carbamoyltransferase [Enterobacteriaceae endosymbiont of Plateumaris consimilis]|uniref:ornithine carbamoyltransferase n=1 Tax=Enterobacteriaceae endosymbiont of Plateumaris consimilis TaxID=2675794 RepID=UPI00144A1CA9|nr:ornithine carbamoyltransferase [Enterobacteriaceae endosymbiont of Plateumaris consimilis]QJC28564.1 ornithine carbamoyltransferase [Enterobacteriaceae endosymbiont of Plateumaris consimilis]